MNDRFIEKDLETWFSSYKKPLIVDGARQVGKTTTIKKFLDDKNKDYIFIDFKQLHNSEVIKIIKNNNIHDLVKYMEDIYKIKKEEM